MYFWDLKKLKIEIMHGKIIESEVFKYFLAFTIFNVIILEIKLPSTLFIGAVNTAITIIGTIYCYRCNGGSNGTSFLERYFVIGWVVTIRYIIIICLPSMIAFGVIGKSIGFLRDKTSEYEVLLFAVLIAGLYWRLGSNIQHVSKHSK